MARQAGQGREEGSTTLIRYIALNTSMHTHTHTHKQAQATTPPSPLRGSLPPMKRHTWVRAGAGFGCFASSSLVPTVTVWAFVPTYTRLVVWPLRSLLTCGVGSAALEIRGRRRRKERGFARLSRRMGRVGNYDLQLWLYWLTWIGNYSSGLTNRRLNGGTCKYGRMMVGWRWRGRVVPYLHT